MKNFMKVMKGETSFEFPERQFKQEVVQVFEGNQLFNIFTHIVNYEASYYTYAIAKPIAYSLFQLQKVNKKLPKIVEELFSQGGAFGGDESFEKLMN